MQEIKCPNCGQVFQVDESGYAQIVQQVRDREFARELDRRRQELADAKENDLTIARLEQERVYKEELSKLQREIERLSTLLQGSEIEKKLAVTEAVQKKEQELSAKSAEILTLEGKLESKDAESTLKEKALKEQYEAALRMKDEQIEYYKDFKARQSTKMVGESLEQHCLTQFNSIRMTAFPNAYFEKDNDARTGSKGDFIFREKDEDGTEFISIMFEMKNESDSDSRKLRNEDHFAKLDRDRVKKNCEFAVLVSLLEPENDFYNDGIADVSHRFPKMYVVRPQFFIPIISLLRQGALASLQYKRELALVRQQDLDVTTFERDLDTFKQGFFKNFEDASLRFGDAVKAIDKAIADLQKAREKLLVSNKHLTAANNKLEGLTVKKLTRKNPTMKAKFDALNED